MDLDVLLVRKPCLPGVLGYAHDAGEKTTKERISSFREYRMMGVKSRAARPPKYKTEVPDDHTEVERGE